MNKRVNKESESTQLSQIVLRGYTELLNIISEPRERISIINNINIIKNKNEMDEYSCMFCFGKATDNDATVCSKCIKVYHTKCISSHICKSRSK